MLCALLLCGCRHFAPTFAEHGLSTVHLNLLDHATLSELGVGSVGARARIRAAAARLADRFGGDEPGPNLGVDLGPRTESRLVMLGLKKAAEDRRRKADDEARFLHFA